MTPSKAVFLDRDGTINEDPGYLNDPEKVRLFPEVRDALAELRKAGFRLIVITNQSGVARGLVQPESLPKIHARINELLGENAQLEHFEICLHHPDTDCACRKPKPKLILDAARALGIDVSRSYMIGDRPKDVLAGRAAGCKGSLMVRTGHGAEEERLLKPGEADFIGDSLRQAADWILRREIAGS